MRSFIVLRRFDLGGNGGIIHYLPREVYKESELITGWSTEKDELDYLQRLGYIVVFQNIHTLVKFILLNKLKERQDV